MPTFASLENIVYHINSKPHVTLARQIGLLSTCAAHLTWWRQASIDHNTLMLGFVNGGQYPCILLKDSAAADALHASCKPKAAVLPRDDCQVRHEVFRPALIL